MIALTVACVVYCQLILTHGESARSPYGQPVGALSQLAHGLKGSVFVVDATRLRLRDFSYDGRGPAGFFWIGLKGSASPAPDRNGQKIPNEKGSTLKLAKYENDDIVLTLPSSLTVDKLAWLSVWCEDFAVDFGHVIFPPDQSVPRPTVIGQLSNQTNGLDSANVTVIDSVTITVEDFTFNGQEQGAYFVIGNSTDAPDKYIKLLNDKGRSAPLDPINAVDVVLTLPSSFSSVLTFQFVGVHSYSTGKTFARLGIPSTLVIPPHINDFRSSTDGN